MKKLLAFLGGLVLLLVALWALSFLFTDNIYIARTLAWFEADVQDYTRFPERVIENQGPVFQFNTAPQNSLKRHALLSLPLSPLQPHNQVHLPAYLAENHTTAFIVIQNDEILFEEYYNGTARDSINTSFSVAKSFDSAMIGIAIAEGYINSVDDPITTYIPELLEKDPRFAEITIRHLIDMDSGIRYQETGMPWGDDAKTYYKPDLRALALTVEIEGQPGEVFHYNNYHPLLEGLILERATGMPVAVYLQEKIWKSMGAEFPASWSLDSHASGFEKMESGINARAIDFARFGRLYLEGGSWQSAQLVPAEWVSESTAASMENDPVWWYQHHWWISSPDGENVHFSARGNFGQYIYVAPEHGLIIVRMGTDYGDADWIGLFESISARLKLVDTGIWQGPENFRLE